jgi:hypothetical protein
MCPKFDRFISAEQRGDLLLPDTYRSIQICIIEADPNIQLSSRIENVSRDTFSI